MKEEMDNEMALLRKIAGTFPRHPGQVNGLSEADGEIIPLAGLAASYLVTKTDGIHEEIKEGLYQDPFLVGWMAVTITVSDLAATGAEPLGLLLSLQIPKKFEETWLQEMQRGINEACVAYNTYILGGDTNFSQEVSLITTGIGTASKPILRKGLQPGDLLYSTAPLGIGNGFAYAKFFDKSLAISYKPIARLQESRVVRKFATACIDTSDGLIPALSVLAEINGTGLRFVQPVQTLLCHETRTACEKAGIPAWLFLAGPHGDYELLFSIPLTQQPAFENACLVAGWQPLLVGEVTENKRLEFISEDIPITCYPAEIANLFDEADGNIQTYFHLLLEKHRQWSTTKTILSC